MFGLTIEKGLPRGNTDPYKYIGTAMTRMMDTNIMKSDESDGSDEEIHGYLLEHLMDTMSVGHKIILLHYVFAKKMTESNLELNELIKKWFISQQINTTGEFPLTALVFYDTSSKKGEEEKIYIRENATNSAGGGDHNIHIWVPAQSEDVKDVHKHLNENDSILPEDVSNLFGFNGDDLKNDNIIFKLKDAQNKRSKGHRCSEMKKDGKVDILRKLLPDDVIEKLKYVSTPKNKDKEVSYHVMQEVCIFVEFTLRHYDFIKKDGKRWFFSYNEHHWFRDILRV